VSLITFPAHALVIVEERTGASQVWGLCLTLVEGPSPHWRGYRPNSAVSEPEPMTSPSSDTASISHVYT
jgi:hypothetical protein